MVLRCRKRMLIAVYGCAAGRKAKPSLSPKSSPLSSLPHPTPRACRGYLRHPGLAGAFSSAKYCRGEELGTQGEKDANVPFILKILPLSFLQMLCELGQTGDLLAAWLPHPSSCNRKCSWEGEVSGLVSPVPRKSHPRTPNPCKGAARPLANFLSKQAKPSFKSFITAFAPLETELPTCLLKSAQMRI